MDFLKSLIEYYQNEYRAGFFTGSVVAGLLLIGGILFWKFASPLSLLRGLTLPFLVAGIFMGAGGMASGYFTRKSYTEKVKLYEQDKSRFFKEEVVKAEKTHKSWFGVRLLWSLVAGAGLLLAVISKKDYLMGVGLGILLFSIVGHITEAVSYGRNEKYYRAVMKAAAAHEKNILHPQEPAERSGNTQPALEDTASVTKKRKTNRHRLSMPVVSGRTDTIPSDTLGFNIIPVQPKIAKMPEGTALEFPEDTLRNTHTYNHIRSNPEIGEVAKDRRAGEFDGALPIKRKKNAKRTCWFKKRQ